MPDIEAEVDVLYGAPLAEFIALRKQVVERLKRAGESEAAKRIGALAKPSVSAWAVNQLRWRSAGVHARLLEAGDRVRSAQSGAWTAEEIRAAVEERRAAILAATREAERALLEAGHAAADATLRKVESTLEALAAYGSAVPAPGPGRFVTDLDPPGFSLVDQPSPPVLLSGSERLQGHGPAKTVSDEAPVPPPNREEARHEAALRAAEGEARNRRRLAQEAAIARDAALKFLDGARAEEAEAARRLAKAREGTRAAELGLQRCDSALAEALEAKDRAEQELAELQLQRAAGTEPQ